MPDNKIIFEIEGTKQDKGHVRLKVFLTHLKSLHQALEQADMAINRSSKATVYYRVVNLSHASPATVELETVPIPGRAGPSPENAASAIAGKFIADANAVRDGGAGDRTIVGPLQKIVRFAGAGFERATVKSNGATLVLDEEFRNRLKAVLVAQASCAGTLEGRLETINLHNHANEFRIYPAIGPAHVVCHFPEALLEKAVQGLRRTVAVTGTMEYQAGAQFPHRISVENLEIYPDAENTPHFFDLRGIAPDLTGGVPSEVFVRTLRDGWRKT